MAAPDSFELIAQLEATPSRLRRAITALGSRIDARPTAEAWSAVEVVRHVRAADAVIGPRIYHILIRERPPLPAFDERAWGERLAIAATPLSDQLDEFQIRRQELVRVLLNLYEADWSREGEHEVRGKMSLSAVCLDLAAHEDEHCGQIEELVAMGYSTDPGVR